MTEQQFQIFCKVIYRVTVATLVLQIAACAMMFWMTWNELPRHEDVTMLLGWSVLTSCAYCWVAKKPLFKREEVALGVGGTTGIMHSLGVNIYFWSFYFFFELFGVLFAIWLYVKTVWL
ncbi:hypothetical protein [Vreelandella zhaodongensis]|uniref:hypothetical protein n=1 Tax=Vreelandella zhaodongensis TaxID=1176240 RepID=UPI003EC09B15